MKKLMIVVLIALPFVTGFTCSKQTPPPTPTELPEPQEQMGAPADSQPTPPADEAPTERSDN